MKRIVPILFVLFLAIPFYAAQRTDSTSAEAPAAPEEKAFPTISKSQVRRPVMRVATDDDVICGYHPDFPTCHFKCNNGVPVLNPDGTQRVICWQEPIYPEYSGGGCSRYYACIVYSTAEACNWSGNPYQGCTFSGTNDCSACDWY